MPKHSTIKCYSNNVEFLQSIPACSVKVDFSWPVFPENAGSEKEDET